MSDDVRDGHSNHHDLLKYCFINVAVERILAYIPQYGLGGLDDDTKLDVLLEIAVACTRNHHLHPLASGNELASMGLSSRFQQDIMRSYDLSDGPLVDKVEEMLRWKFAGLRTVMDESRRPRSMTSLLSTRIIVEDELPEICGVCRQEKSTGECVKVLPCGHWFDEACLESWLGISNSCPACRATAVDVERLRQVIPW